MARRQSPSGGDLLAISRDPEEEPQHRERCFHIQQLPLVTKLMFVFSVFASLVLICNFSDLFSPPRCQNCWKTRRRNNIIWKMSTRVLPPPFSPRRPPLCCAPAPRPCLLSATAVIPKQKPTAKIFSSRRSAQAGHTPSLFSHPASTYPPPVFASLPLPLISRRPSAWTLVATYLSQL